MSVAKPKVTIVYAYGASNQEGVHVKAAAEAHLTKLDLRFDTIDWRPHHPAPALLDLESVSNRDPSNSNQSSKVGAKATLVDDLVATLQWPANVIIRRMNRGLLMGSGTTLADVLRYIDDPKLVRRHVKAEFQAAVTSPENEGRSVIALGLSLGGIMLADVLRDKETVKPAGLITIGSQYSALRRLGVVDLNTNQEPLFSPWVNIWHKNDLLSYPAGITFASGIGQGGGDEVVDIRSKRRGIFPKVHSGYLLKGSADWKLIEEAILKHILP